MTVTFSGWSSYIAVATEVALFRLDQRRPVSPPCGIITANHQLDEGYLPTPKTALALPGKW
jgi:hypothetical protein